MDWMNWTLLQSLNSHLEQLAVVISMTWWACACKSLWLLQSHCGICLQSMHACCTGRTRKLFVHDDFLVDIKHLPNFLDGPVSDQADHDLKQGFGILVQSKNFWKSSIWSLEYWVSTSNSSTMQSQCHKCLLQCRPITWEYRGLFRAKKAHRWDHLWLASQVPHWGCLIGRMTAETVWIQYCTMKPLWALRLDMG